MIKYTKKEMRLYCAELVECGKGFALASHMEEGSEQRKAAEKVLNEHVYQILKQLELTCSDVDYSQVEEYLQDGEEKEKNTNPATA